MKDKNRIVPLIFKKRIKIYDMIIVISTMIGLLILVLWIYILLVKGIHIMAFVGPLFLLFLLSVIDLSYLQHKKYLANFQYCLQKRAKMMSEISPVQGTIVQILEYENHAVKGEEYKYLFSTYTMLVECTIDGQKQILESLVYGVDLQKKISSPIVSVYYDENDHSFLIEHLQFGSSCNLPIQVVEETIDAEIEREKRQSFSKWELVSNYTSSEKKKVTIFLSVGVLLWAFILFFLWEFTSEFKFVNRAPFSLKAIYISFLLGGLTFLTSIGKNKIVSTILGYCTVIVFLSVFIFLIVGS